jgi:hypothetical protein
MIMTTMGASIVKSAKILIIYGTFPLALRRALAYKIVLGTYNI